MLRLALAVILLAFPGLTLALGKDTRSLQEITPRYFELGREYSPEESQFLRGSRVFPGPTLCKGRYVAKYKDRHGMYFAPPADCNAPLVLGVWIPDDPQKHGYDTWLIIGRSKGNYGLVVNWLDSLEAGNYAKSGFTLVGAELVEQFKNVHELSSPP